MKAWSFIGIGFLGYSLCAYLMYSPFFRVRPQLYYWTSLAVGNFISLLWLDIARTRSSKEEILFYGNVWDFGLMAAYSIVPILFFGVKLNRGGLLGMALIIFGLVIFKLNQ